MPAQETEYLFDKAVVWPFIGYDRSGQPKVGDPYEVWVRWLTKRRDVLDTKGNTIALDAEAVTEDDIPMDSVMRLGTLSDWQGTGSNQMDTELMLVKTFNYTPDVKERDAYRCVGLMRYKNVINHG